MCIKKQFLIPVFIILGLLFWSMANSKEHPANDFKTFTEYMHHSCSGSSFLGGKCGAMCRDRCNCICNSNFFYCDCFCDCPEKNMTLNRSIDPGPKSNWELLKKLVEEENSEVAKNLSPKIMELYQIGAQNRVDDYTRSEVV